MAPSSHQIRLRQVRLCAACESPLAAGDEFICLYGETVHRGCAFYRERTTRPSLTQVSTPPSTTWSTSEAP
jgi:hypothetical protein